MGPENRAGRQISESDAIFRVQKARADKVQAEAAQAAEQRVYTMLEDAHVNLQAVTQAENADNLDEAVACYLSYDEYTLDGLMEEIREQYGKAYDDA